MLHKSFSSNNIIKKLLAIFQLTHNYNKLNYISFFISLNLTVNFFSTKYTKHIAGCPRLPNQMRFNICAMDDLPCYVERPVLRFSNDDFDEDDGEEDINKYINLSASVGVTIQEMNRNFNRMGNSVCCNYEQSMQIHEPRNLPEFSKSTEEGLSDLSQASERIIEWRRRDSTSLSPSSCTEYGGMEQVSQKSTPRSSDNEAMTDGLLLSPEGTIINLCTPSSGIVRSKTKRALFDSAIIDLTDSPIIIQI